MEVAHESLESTRIQTGAIREYSCKFVGETILNFSETKVEVKRKVRDLQRLDQQD